MTQPAEGAALGVRAEHPLAEGDLVEPPAERRGHIRSPGLGRVLTDGCTAQRFTLTRCALVPSTPRGALRR